MPSNIIWPSPKKLVAPSEKVEKSSGNLDDIEAPVARISQTDLDNKKEGENTNKYDFQGQYER